MTAIMVASLSGSASADQPAKRKVDLKVYEMGDAGVFGFLGGKKMGSCSTGRQVSVFRKNSGGETSRIARRTTRRSPQGAIWSVRNKRATSGTLFFRAEGTPRCAPDKARKTVSPDDPMVHCPSVGPVCYLDRIHIADTVAPFDETSCHTWDRGPRDSQPVSHCSAEILDGRAPFCCWDQADVSWQRPRTADDGRSFSFEASRGETTKVEFTGHIPFSNSNRYYVDSAKTPAWSEHPDVEWFTPNLGPDAKPGEAGGPLYFVLDPGSFRGFDFYMAGFFYRR